MKLFSSNKHEEPVAPQPRRHGAPWHISGVAVRNEKGGTIIAVSRLNLLLRTVSKQDIDDVYASNLSANARADRLGLTYNDMYVLHAVYAGRVTNAAIVNNKLVQVTEPTEDHMPEPERKFITLPVDELAQEVTALDVHIHHVMAEALRTLADLLDPKP